MSDVSPVDEQAAKAITDQESSELIGYRQTDEQKLAMVEFVAAKLAAARPVSAQARERTPWTGRALFERFEHEAERGRGWPRLSKVGKHSWDALAEQIEGEVLAAARPVPEDAGDERQRAEHAARCDVAVVTARTVGGEVRLQDSLRVRVLRGALTEARAVLETARDGLGTRLGRRCRAAPLVLSLEPRRSRMPERSEARVSQGGEGRLVRMTPEQQRAHLVAMLKGHTADIATQRGWDLAVEEMTPEYVALLDRERRILDATEPVAVVLNSLDLPRDAYGQILAAVESSVREGLAVAACGETEDELSSLLARLEGFLCERRRESPEHAFLYREVKTALAARAASTLKEDGEVFSNRPALREVSTGEFVTEDGKYTIVSTSLGWCVHEGENKETVATFDCLTAAGNWIGDQARRAASTGDDAA